MTWERKSRKARQGYTSDDVGRGEGREGTAKLLLGRISCIVGLLFGGGGILFTLFGASINVSAGAVGAVLGILGYFLGAGRLGTVTIVVSIVTLFLGIAATQGVIPGLEPSDRGLPAVEPRAAE
jgi:hypothetical protein